MADNVVGGAFRLTHDNRQWSRTMAIPVIGGLIGRMFSNQEARSSYGASRAQPAVDGGARTRGDDTVELSADVPEPLQGRLFRDAAAIGKKLAEGRELTPQENARLREDRVFAALATINAIGLKGNGGSIDWPGGFPVPTADEMAAAYRRLTQRLQNLNTLRDPEAMQQIRQTVLDGLRGVDFLALERKISGAG